MRMWKKTELEELSPLFKDKKPKKFELDTSEQA